MTLIPPPKGAEVRIARNMILTFTEEGFEDPMWCAYLHIMRAMENSHTFTWQMMYLKAAELVAAQMV